MKEFIQHALDLNTLRKKVGFLALWQASKSDLRWQVLNNPSDLFRPTTDHLKILVLAPHPDDDIFALGGTLTKFAKNRDEITILYLCDGSKGTSSGIRDSSMIIKRKKEAKEATQCLGIENLIFWGYRDGQLTSNSTSTKALAEVILKLKPDIIFLPSLSDNHPDHLVTTDILYKSLFKSDLTISDFPYLIASFEIWTPLFANRIIDITDVIKTKEEAILKHKTQLKSRRYDKAIIALNQYHAELNGIKGYAEAFFVCNPAIYRKLYEKIK